LISFGMAGRVSVTPFKFVKWAILKCEEWQLWATVMSSLLGFVFYPFQVVRFCVLSIPGSIGYSWPPEVYPHRGQFGHFPPISLGFKF
jgi:hypothetical protein